MTKPVSKSKAKTSAGNRMTLRTKDTVAAEFRPIAQTDRLYLREVRLTDVNERYYAWMNDPEINRYLESRFQTLSLENLTDYVKAMDASPENHFFAICTRDGDRHIGNIKLGPINWHHRRAEIGLVIGEKSYWGKGVATEAIAMVTQYAFENLCLLKLRAGAYAANEGSARAFEKVGWTREGLMRDDVLLDGKPHDCIMLGMTAADYWTRQEKQDKKDNT